MTHSPGPWTVERDGYTLMMGHQVVATGLAPDGASPAEQRANARLIAAAPQMLAEILAMRSPRSFVLEQAGYAPGCYCWCDEEEPDHPEADHWPMCLALRELLARITTL